MFKKTTKILQFISLFGVFMSGLTLGSSPCLSDCWCLWKQFPKNVEYYCIKPLNQNETCEKFCKPFKPGTIFTDEASCKAYCQKKFPGKCYLGG
jgi:hypothetical protein